MKRYVEDRWFWHWGKGVVVKKTATRVHVFFSCKGLVKYDLSHAKKFLQDVK